MVWLIYPLKTALITHWIGEWVSLKISVDAMMTRKFSAAARNQTLNIQTIAWSLQ
jgi:hypothetical protein